MALKTRARFVTVEAGKTQRDRAARNIVPGDWIKVVVATPKGNEAFWLRVVKNKRRGGPWVGIIDNKLLFTDAHGLKFGQKLTIQRKHLVGVIWGRGGERYADDKRAKNPLSWEQGRKKNPTGTDGPTPRFRHGTDAATPVKNPKPKKQKAVTTQRTDDHAKGWKAIKRAPISLAGKQLAELGHVLEVEAGPYLFKWRKRERLLWDAATKSLVILQGATVGRSKAERDAQGKAAAAYKNFMGRGVSMGTRAKMPKVAGTWRKLAPARRVDYRSDKFNRRPKEYTHKHDGGVTLYRAGGSAPPWVWVIRGGRLRVTARGIEG